MNSIDQHSAVISQEEALLPSSVLIDGRTERDRLSFLAEFASVINFYDNNNEIHGNWVPFLLKDPVFLLAHISDARFTEIHNRYKNICYKLEQVLVYQTSEGDISVPMNQLFDLITHLFMRIERWTYHMQNSSEDYDLKEYVINQVRSKFSAVFWAVLALRENLVYTKAVPDIRPVKYYLFQSYDDRIWKQNRELHPFWDILGIKLTHHASHPLISPLQCYNTLKNAATDLFNFFYTTVQYSHTAFENQKTKTSQYPDTVLLRTFINLLGIHQEQLNGITNRHLGFYYKDILKQKKNLAKADSAFICAELSKLTAVVNLAPGVLFNAGLDAQKNPIVFSTTKTTELNPASISNVCTLACLTAEDKLITLCKTVIPDPGIVNKDTAGNVIGWETFGGSSLPSSVAPTLGFAFASPLLLLREGCRKIVLRFGYDASEGSPVNSEMFSKASFFLSTQSSWLSLSPDKPINSICSAGGDKKEITVNESSVNPFYIEINLDMTHPAIEAFQVNPDGLQSEWPMFKVEFPSVADPEKPPLLTSISVEVTVSNMKNLQLYNDFGALSTKTPYQLFGPTPLLNSNFIIGSNEIFTKPITDLSLELNWDKLPDSFTTYYQQYNVYLNNNGNLTVNQQGQKGKETGKSIIGTLTGPFRFIINSVKKRFVKPGTTSTSAAAGVSDPAQTTTSSVMPWLVPFNDDCFKVNFQALKNNSWSPLNLIKKKNPPVTGQVNDQTSATTENEQPQKLFNSPLNPPGGNAQTSFVNSDSGNPIAPFPCDPSLQNTPLKYTDASSDAFIKIELAGPELGFGSGIYPNVIAYYAMVNAYNISHSKDQGFTPISLCGVTNSSDTGSTPQFVICPPPNLPFAPKLSGLTVSYTAAHTYTLKNGCADTMENKDQIYPLQCFLYSVFNNYLVYDNAQKKKDYINNYLTSLVGTKKITNGVPLFSSFEDEGALFIQLKDLLPAEKLNLYLELKKTSGGINGKSETEYYYLSNTGWKNLNVLCDTTDKFTCSGILSVAVPSDITNVSTTMGNDQKFWLAFTTKSKPGSFAQTLFLKTNGFVVERAGDTFLKNYQAPVLPANSIVKPQNPIPEIATVIQPFSSFGGKGAENTLQMNRRVSNRLKTKDRLVSSEDYYRIINQQFNDIYYSKSILNRYTKKIEVFLVQSFPNASEAGAFVPVVSKCTEEKIKKFLKERTSAFCELETLNFELQKVKISAIVALKSGYEKAGMEKKINDSLNVFLSPWIKSATKQVVIDEEITAAQVADYIQSIEGVDSIQCVGFSTWKIDISEGTQTEPVNEIPGEQNTPEEKLVQCGQEYLLQSVKPLTATTLMISCMKHEINCEPAE